MSVSVEENVPHVRFPDVFERGSVRGRRDHVLPLAERCQARAQGGVTNEQNTSSPLPDQ